MYNSALARFNSGDPIGCVFPWQSPYAYSLNSPIVFLDAEGAGPMKYFISSGLVHIKNLIAGARSTVHNLTAIIKGGKPWGKDDIKEFGKGFHDNDNHSDTYDIVPGQSVFWYNDFNEYDQIQIYNPGPPKVLIWETGSGDNREKEPGSEFYKATNKDSKFMSKSEDISDQQLPKGWASLPLDESYPKKILIEVNATNPPNRNPITDTGHSQWGFYIRKNSPEPPKKKKDKSEPRESHMNVRFL